MNVERKLLWWKNVETEFPQLFGWNFLIINESREMKIVRDKICEALEIVQESRKIDSGVIMNSGGLHYDLFTMYSPTAKVSFCNVYEGSVKKDRRLYMRKTEKGWNSFIDKIASGQI
jgi:hypothetical protein